MIFVFEDYRIDAARFEVRQGRHCLAAEPQVLDLLICLLRNRDRVVTRDEILDAVWKGRIVGDAALSSRVKAARRLIGDDGKSQRAIRTIHGRGFRFVGEVLVDEEPPRPVSAEDVPTPAAAPGRLPAMPPGLAPYPTPEVHYARSGSVHVAYQCYGNGPARLVYVPAFVSNIGRVWEFPPANSWMGRLGEFATVAIFDKRGTGMSDPVTDIQDIEERTDDLRAVMDAAGFEQAFVLGLGDGCPLAAVFAAKYPDRTQGLLLWGGFARFASWCPDGATLDEWIRYIETDWGAGGTFLFSAHSMAIDPVQRKLWGKFERFGATPGAALSLMRMNSRIDIAAMLPAVHVPTLVMHRTHDRMIDVGGSRELAAGIPGARLIEYDGLDHLPFLGETADAVLADIGDFLAGGGAPPEQDSTLVTLVVAVFDPAPGDGAPPPAGNQTSFDRALVLRAAMTRYRGRALIVPRGARLAAAFDRPTRAVAFAQTVLGAFALHGQPLRLGIHTGPILMHPVQTAPDGAPEGAHSCGATLEVATHLAESAANHAILTSRIVRDLARGAAFDFDPTGGACGLGDSEPWPVFRVRSPAAGGGEALRSGPAM